MSLRFFESTDKAACCGCTACEAVCPVSAIRMERAAFYVAWKKRLIAKIPKGIKRMLKTLKR